MICKNLLGQSSEAAKGLGAGGNGGSARPVAGWGKQSAFTLIELLVVISVLIVLLAILIPSLNRAKGLGQAVVCGSNLHQIGIGFGASRSSDAILQQTLIKYPSEILWPSVPGKVVSRWDVFRCPVEPDVWGVRGALEFRSQLGYYVAFAPGPCCVVRQGPAPNWGWWPCPVTPAGVTDYGFEDLDPSGSGGGDCDDALCRVYDPPIQRGEIIFGTAGFSNCITAYGQTVVSIPPVWGPVNPPIPFAIPDGLTNYGYNAKMGVPESGASLVALDYSKAVANHDGEDVAAHLGKALRHFDQVNVLFADNSVRRMSFSQLDPTIEANRGQWGNSLMK